MAYFNFCRLIQKYMSEFVVITPAQGEYQHGEYIKGENTETTLKGAIIGIREDKIYRSTGTLTAKDKQLFMLQPIDRAMLGATAIFKGEKYNVQADTENADFTDVFPYILKYVSAFGGVDGD